MLDHKASRFFRAALQSGLIDEASLDACWEAVPADKRVADAIDRRLARQTITAGHLTLWQAQQILGGRTGGFKIDKYLLLDLIGRGGMGRVYLARDLRLNRLVALKILSHERMTNPRAIARFQREAKVGAQLQHENLVRIYDEGEANGIRYLVMEFIEGKNIGQLIGEAGSIPWPTAARLARQVAMGLEHARLKGLIHRDVNPCNILVMADGTAKLTDLGLAIDLADQDNVTRDGATVGTFDYVSPEQARHSRSVDTRADLYSLGCTLYHMISGRVPFPVASLPEKLYAHQLHDPEPLNEVVPGVPEGLAAVVRKLMRKNPDERQPTPQVVAQELEPYASESGWAAAATVSAASERESALSARAPASPAVGDSASPDAPASWANPAASGSGSSQGLGSPDSFFPLDLGPEVPLSGGLRPTRPISKASKSRTAEEGSEEPRRARRLLPWMLGFAAAVLAISAVVFLASRFLHGPDPATDGHTSPGVAGDGAVPAVDIQVRGRDGQSHAAKTLAEAIARAVRSGGEVLLAGTAPLKLAKASIIVPDGDLVIRAAAGSRPVLDVMLEGALPLFDSRANLRLKGLTIIVRRESTTDAPLLNAERDVTLERCVFRVEGKQEGSRALVVGGSRTTIVGCLFAGFDRPLDIVAAPGTSVALKQTMLLSDLSEGRSSGGVVHVLNAFGRGVSDKGDRAPVCRMTVDDCTIKAGTFLDVNQFAESTPLGISVSGTAFQVRALLAFGAEQPTPDALAKAVLWEGKANHFQVAGPGWATVPGQGPLPGGPTDLQSWSTLLREADGQSQGAAPAWKTGAETPTASDPRDNAVVGHDGTTRGADPAQVGPK